MERVVGADGNGVGAFTLPLIDTVAEINQWFQQLVWLLP